MAKISFHGTLCLCALLAVTGQSRQTIVIPRVLPIVDEAPQDTELQRVRDNMLRAARAGDMAFVRDRIDSQIQTSLEGARGFERLEKQWHIAKSPVEFLRALANVLSLGGRFDRDAPEHTVFVAPSMWFDFPDDSQIGSYGVVTGRDAPAYQHPSSSSQILVRLNCDVLRMWTAYAGATRGFVQVELHDGQTAYVKTDDIRSPADERAYLAKVHGRWMLTGFYAGAD